MARAFSPDALHTRFYGTIFSKQDWIIGAIWRMASRGKLRHSNQVRALLEERAGLSWLKASQLASIWRRYLRLPC